MTCCPTCKRPFQIQSARGITPRQYEALQFIKTFTDEHGYSPSLQEIATAMGFASRGYVSKIVGILRMRGAIETQPRVRRSIVVIEPPALRGTA